MRTTLDIEDSVLAAVKALAHAEGRSIGAVASELIRRGLSSGLHGFHPFAAANSDDRVTNEQVNRLREDLGL